MSLLKAARYFLEGALHTEEGKKAMKGAKLHCREQLLVARIMATQWKSKSPDEWQHIINQTNVDYPEWSPLCNASPATTVYVAGEGEAKNLASVWTKGRAGALRKLYAAEDQFISLHEATMAGNEIDNVHDLVKIAYQNYVPGGTAVPLNEAALPSNAAMQQANIQQLVSQNRRLAEEKEELTKQIIAAKDANLDDFRAILRHGVVAGPVGLAVVKAMNGNAASKKKRDDDDDDDVQVLKREVASLTEKNSKLEGLLAEADKQKKKLIKNVKAALAEKTAAFDEKTAEMDEALAYKSEELYDSQGHINCQEAEIDHLKEKIDTLNELIRKLRIDLSAMEVMIMFAGKEEDIDIDALWDRTLAYIATKRGSVDEAVAAAVKQYTLP